MDYEAKMSEETARVRDISPHPGQMRSAMDHAALLELTEQVRARGIDPDRLIVVTDRKDASATAFTVVRGHRRFMALCLSQQGDPGKVLLEVAGDLIPCQCCPKCGEWLGVDDLPNSMQCPGCDETVWGVGAAVGERFDVSPTRLADPATFIRLRDMMPEDATIRVFVAHYPDEQMEHTMLIADAYGVETPDVIGQAKAFAAAVSAGVSVEQLAANIGRPEAYVMVRLALAQMPGNVHGLVTEGVIPVGAVAFLARLENDELVGSVAHIRGYSRMGAASVRDQVERIIEHRRLLTGPLDMARTLRDRNRARIKRALFAEVIRLSPTEAWTAAGAGRTSIQGLAHMLALSEDMVATKVPAVGCDSCQIREDLKALPRLTWHPGYPCQQADGEDVIGCQYAVGSDEQWAVFIGHGVRDVEGVDRGYCHDRKRLEEIMAEFGGSNDDASLDDAADAGTSNVSKELTKQRAQIRTFMERHLELSGAGHPLATRCADCVHRTSESPVKAAPDAPHCLWSKGRRRIFFVRFVTSDDGEEIMIPMCGQYAPSRPWAEIIPASPWPSDHMPLSLMREMIRRWAMTAGRRLGSHQGFMPVLTGRPTRSADAFGSWFLDQFEAQKAELDDARTFTLLLYVFGFWCWVEYSTRHAPLPTAGGTMRDWRYDQHVPLEKWWVKEEVGGD